MIHSSPMIQPSRLLVGLLLVSTACKSSDTKYDYEGFDQRIASFQTLEEETSNRDEPLVEVARSAKGKVRSISADDIDFEGVQIHLMDSGQADAMLVVSPVGKTLLIDLGEENGVDSENFLGVAQRILDTTGKSHVDYLVVSHFHHDHTGGNNNGIAGLLDWVDPQFTVGMIIDLHEWGAEYMKPTRNTKTKLESNIDRWLSENKLGAREEPQFGTDQINLGGGLSVDIVTFGGKASADDPGRFAEIAARYPNLYEDAPGSENDISIGMFLRYGDFEMFTAGDLTGYSPKDWPDWPFAPLYTPRSFGETYTNVESHLVEAWAVQDPGLNDIEVYRANHHGSQYSSSPEFLAALDPEVVLYSCGGGYGHPKPTVLDSVSETARQYVTSRVASNSWSKFTEVNGQVLGGMILFVAEGGGSYELVSTREGSSFREEHDCFTNLEEANNDDAEAHLGSVP